MFEGLKTFQQEKIDELSNVFLELWKTGNYKLPITFKAPTGAGKTVMIAEFLRCLDDNFHFHEDKAYIWVSFGGDESYTQSKEKLYKYYNEGTDMSLKDISNLSEGKLFKNSIFFINWSKIKGTDKESKKLRKPNEYTGSEFGVFDEYIKNTKKERELVLIIDEAHTETDTTLANEVIDLLNPRLIIKVTATPKDIPSASDIARKKAGYVEAFEEDVIASGLIKQNIIIQTEEDINKVSGKGLSEDEIMLELAYNKRVELKKMYADIESNKNPLVIKPLVINPLVLIQLPSDFKEKEKVATNQKNMVLSYLKDKGVKDDEIAIWLSNEKKNLEFIERNDSSVNFLIFKVAPATGWDCPRADILVMFREITSPTFHTQIIGRIKRMPEGNHYSISELNNAYIYTNYNKSHIRDIKDTEFQNKLPIYFTEIKKDIEQIELVTTFHNRADFNSLTPPPLWQKMFVNVFDEIFETSNEPLEINNNYEKVNSKFDLSKNNVINQIVVDAQIGSFDNFIDEIKAKGKDINYHYSQLDVEKLYNLACYEELKKQDEDEAKYNAARSWGQLKAALNVWFSTRLGIDRNAYYSIIVNELLKESSILSTAINKALKEFRVKYEIEVKEKETRDIFDLIIPDKSAGFTDDYEQIIGITKNVYNEFYIRKEYLGRKNEEEFISHIDKEDNIIWWHKQSDSGRNVFAIEYYDSQEKKNSLFYPDFIIRTDNKLFILDTKSGSTAKYQQTADKNNQLQKWIKESQLKYSFKILGGMIIKKYPKWLINCKENYVYENNEDWEELVLN